MFVGTQSHFVHEYLADVVNSVLVHEWWWGARLQDDMKALNYKLTEALRSADIQFAEVHQSFV